MLRDIFEIHLFHLFVFFYARRIGGNRVFSKKGCPLSPSGSCGSLHNSYTQYVPPSKGRCGNGTHEYNTPMIRGLVFFWDWMCSPMCAIVGVRSPMFLLQYSPEYVCYIDTHRIVFKHLAKSRSQVLVHIRCTYEYFQDHFPIDEMAKRPPPFCPIPPSASRIRRWVAQWFRKAMISRRLTRPTKHDKHIANQRIFPCGNLYK